MQWLSLMSRMCSRVSEQTAIKKSETVLFIVSLKRHYKAETSCKADSSEVPVGVLSAEVLLYFHSMFTSLAPSGLLPS